MIRWAEDLGAPALVAAADIAMDELKPDWNRPVGIGLAAAGYILGGLLGMGGTFVKNIGIAAAPWAFGSIYQYIKEASGTPVSRRTQMPVRTKLGGRVSSYPAQPHNREYLWPTAV
jgi:hypothetical protein